MSDHASTLSDEIWALALRRVESDDGLREELDSVGIEFSEVRGELMKEKDARLDALAAQIDECLNAREGTRLTRRHRLRVFASVPAVVIVAVGVATFPALEPKIVPTTQVWLATSSALGLGIIGLAARAALEARSIARNWEARAARQFSEAVDRLQGELAPLARNVANGLANVPFNSIRLRRALGLSEIIAPSLEVSTNAKQELASVLSSMEAASVGISGSRGAGKSTLIAAACEGRLDDGVEPLGVLVPAPMKYQSVEFVPYLFNQLCLKIAPDQERTADAAARRRRRLAALGAQLGAGLVGLGVLTLTGAISASTEKLAFAVPVIGLGFVIALAGMIWIAARSTSRFSDEETKALRELHALRFRDTLVRGWTGEAGPDGLRLAGKKEISSSEQPPTLPDLVARYRNFVRDLAKDRPVVIGIDELDKMQPGEAQELLNDVKVLFGERNCFYLVSMSQDAMSAFERRGMPIRDVFDSSFDTVLHVEPLTAPEASALLGERVVGLGAGAVMLAHALSGGLPRELIRSARALRDATGENPSVSLDVVTKRVVRERIVALERATIQAVAKRPLQNGSQPVAEWIRGMRELSRRPSLAERWKVGAILRQIRNSGLSTDEIASQTLIVLELAAAAYHADAIWAFFVDLRRDAFLQAQNSVAPQPAAIELIARGHADMSVSPHAAWLTVNAFRESVGLPTSVFPSP